MHGLAARVAQRAGDADAEAHHRMEAMRLCPDDAMTRRRAAASLRRAGQQWPLVEVLRAEAAYGDRVSALLTGAELLLDALRRADLAMSWAAEAHTAAREGTRPVDAARALDLIDRARDALAAPTPEPVAPAHGHPIEVPMPETSEPAVDSPRVAPAIADPPAHGHPIEPPLDDDAPIDLDVLAPSADAPALETITVSSPKASSIEASSIEVSPEGSKHAAPAPVPHDQQAAELAVANAVTHEAAGDVARAIEALEEALRHHPAHREALERVANLYAEAGRTAEALRAVEELLSVTLDPIEEAGLRALRALWHPEPSEAERELRLVLDGGVADAMVLDLCIETAKARGLWKVGAALQERRFPL